MRSTREIIVGERCLEMEALLRKALSKKTCFIGIGNVLKGDDGVGPSLIQRINKTNDILCIDAGTTPENQLGTIIRFHPERIIFIDATDLGKKPGEFELIDSDHIVNKGFTTHDISPALLLNFLKQETNATLHLLGIQPESMLFGSPISETVERTIADLAEIINRILSE